MDPFKAVQLKRKGKSLRFAGKAIRVFEQELLDGGKWKSGCFAQDAVGGLVAVPSGGEGVCAVGRPERRGGARSGTQRHGGDERRGEARGGVLYRDRERKSPKHNGAATSARRSVYIAR